MGLPVRRFNPAPGITVDQNGTATIITGTMEAWGAEATAARATRAQGTVNRYWTTSFPDGYSVRCSIRIVMRAPGAAADPNRAQIEMLRMTAASNVQTDWPHAMQLNLSTDVDRQLDWVVAHEFGHVLGMDDRYSESIMSQLGDATGLWAREGTRPHAGYDGHLMGADRGAMSPETLRDLHDETTPSPWWRNDDDQVRAWIMGHSLDDIASVRTADKISAFNVLMSGWISDDDVLAMRRLCAGVRTADEANAIRAAVRLTVMTSLGQRTTMRVAFSRMPGG